MNLYRAILELRPEWNKVKVSDEGVELYGKRQTGDKTHGAPENGDDPWQG